MPSTSERMRRFMGKELSDKRAGKPTETGMSEDQLRDFASRPVEKLGRGYGKDMKHGHGRHANPRDGR